MASRTPGSSGRRWSAAIWPNTPPPLPEMGFRGPYGLWDAGPGGVFMSYEMAEAQGFIEDDRLRHPPVKRSESGWSANDRRYATWAAEYHANRGETYLALLALDLSSGDAILDFVSTYGVLDIRALDSPPADRQWYGTAQPKSVPLRMLRHYPGFGEGHKSGSLDSTLRDDVVAICQAERAAAPIWLIEETLHEFIYGAEAIRDLVTAWDCLRNDEDPRTRRWANPRMPSAGDSENLAVSATTTFLEHTLSDALERFSPRIYLLDGQGRRSFDGARSTPSPRDVTLFELLALEIFRHIAEDAAFKPCVKCGKLFVRQEGGAAHGQSRLTGVKYCSRLCAKAAAQRAYRDRRRRAGAATDG